MARKRNTLTSDQETALGALKAMGGNAVYWEIEGKCRQLGLSGVSLKSLVTKGVVTYIARTPTAPARYKVVQHG